jgi:hypothetical protein
MRQRRTLNPGLIINALLAYAVAVLVLLGFFLRGSFESVLGVLSDWVTLLVAFALLLGLGNIVRVHLGRLMRRHPGWPYSLVLLVSALAVIVVGYIDGTPGGANVQWIFRWVYTPLGASLFALLAFFVLTAALRTLRAGPSAAWLLLAVALIVIAGSAPWSQVPPLDPLARLQEWIIAVPALGGMRGLMLGAALGAIATSLRVLLGFDRPYLS